MFFRIHQIGQKFWHISVAQSCRTTSQRFWKMTWKLSLSRNMSTKSQKLSRYAFLITCTLVIC